MGETNGYKSLRSICEQSTDVAYDVQAQARNLIYRSYSKFRHTGSFYSTSVQITPVWSLFSLFHLSRRKTCSFVRKVHFLFENVRNVAEVTKLLLDVWKFHRKLKASSAPAINFVMMYQRTTVNIYFKIAAIEKRQTLVLWCLWSYGKRQILKHFIW